MCILTCRVKGPEANTNPLISRIFISLLTFPLLKITFVGVLAKVDGSLIETLSVVPLGGVWPKVVNRGPEIISLKHYCMR